VLRSCSVHVGEQIYNLKLKRGVVIVPVLIKIFVKLTVIARTNESSNIQSGII